MILHDRDTEILACLMRYKYVTSDQIYRLFFQGRTKSAMYHVFSRLRDLGVIEQRKFSYAGRMGTGALLYLTDKGAKFLAQEWETTVDRLNYKRIVYPIQSLNHLYHKKREIDFWIKMDEDLQGLPLTLKEIATDGERVYRNGRQMISTHIETADQQFILIPDLYFILRNEEKNVEALYFVEIDTGKQTIGGRFKTVSQNSLIEKYQIYEKMLREGHWKTMIDTTATAFQVLTVTEKVSHIEGIRKKAQYHVKWKHLFLLTTHDQVEKKGVFSQPNWFSLESVSSPQTLL